MRAALFASSFVLAVAACSGEMVPDDAAADAAEDGGRDAGTMPCEGDGDCDDGLFCNGVETCSPADPSADLRGCAPPAAPGCAADETCEEATDVCLGACATNPDADGDGIDATECGGADCDDADATRYPGALETCDAADVDEDCDPTTFGVVDADGDSVVSDACCNVDAGGTSRCGADCDDLRADIRPLQNEVCNTLDDDCDGVVDVDGGGLDVCECPSVGASEACGSDTGECVAGMRMCTMFGWTTCDGIGESSETCDGLDNDCDAMTDEVTTSIGERLSDDHIAHCGTCGNSCEITSNQTSSMATCTEGNCTMTCAAPRANCDAVYTNGCETDTTTHIDHCAGCGMACPTRTNATRTCAASTCGFTCTSGFGDCDTSRTNGCEVTFASGSRTSDDQVINCGGCGTTGTRNCQVTSNTATSMANCAAGACTLACSSNYGNCDAMYANGCEVNFTSGVRVNDDQVYHCGACGTTGAPNCQITSNTSVSMASCTSGDCTMACSTGYGNCDTSFANGCEATFATGVRVTDEQVDHCGGCGTTSPRRCQITSNGANSMATCVSGVCSMACSPGYGNCDVVYANGCETSTTTTTNCGMCGRACAPVTNGAPTCTAGVCGFTCNGGYVASGMTCVAVAPPRLIAPMSTSVVTSTTPRLEWAGAAPADGVEIQICRDRACTMVSATMSAQPLSGNVVTTTALTPGTYFWRARSRRGTGYSPTWSAPWLFRLYDTNAATIPNAGGTSWGAELDLQGDGLSDVALGRNLADAFEVYYGQTASPGLPATASASRTSIDGTDGRFGVSVASAGDVNGDGFGDLIVGACAPSATVAGDAPDDASCINNAYLYLGSATGIAATPTRIPAPTGTAALSGFGYSVGSAGDVNRDGYGDVVVGAYWTHRAYVYLGSATGITTTVHRTLQANDDATSGYFGISVATGDVNGDRYADVIVGRPLHATPSVFVFCGSSTGIPMTPCARLVGTGTYGISVGVTDFNGDGVPDVLGSHQVDVGLVRIFFGGNGSIDTTFDREWTHSVSGTRWGISVTGLGDVNGDGYGDFVVGEPATMIARIHAGNTASGSGPLAIVSDMGVTPEFGRFVAHAGSFNGDRFSDFVIGSCAAGASQTCSDRAFAVYGASSPLVTNWTHTGTSGFSLGANR